MLRSFILILVIASIKSASANPNQGSSISPSEGMKKYAESLSFLLQNIGLPAAQDKAVQKQINEYLSTLTSISHEIQDSFHSIASDPLMKYLSLDMPQQFSRVEQEYNKGNQHLARQLLRHTTQYCLACHSSSASKHSSALQFSDPTPKLPLLEQAEYFSATRQHEKALLAYEKILAETGIARQEPQTWLSAISNMIALTVRMRQSPHLSLETSSRFLNDMSQLDHEQLAMLRAWRQSAKDWVEESKKNYKPDEQLKQAQALLTKGTDQKNPTHGFVDFLRVMNIVNQLVIRTSDASHRAEGFRLAGKAMEKMAGVYVWMRPDVYYEACIRSYPKSKEARHCWQDLSSHLQLNSAALQKFPWYHKLQELAH